MRCTGFQFASVFSSKFYYMFIRPCSTRALNTSRTTSPFTHHLVLYAHPLIITCFQNQNAVTDPQVTADSKLLLSLLGTNYQSKSVLPQPHLFLRPSLRLICMLLFETLCVFYFCKRHDILVNGAINASKCKCVFWGGQILHNDRGSFGTKLLTRWFA